MRCRLAAMNRLLIAVWALACAAPAAGVIRHVPADHPTIQAAILAAADGDEVVVAPGTYPEQIDFLGKAITVRSSAGPAATIISGGGVVGPLVSFVNGEGPATRFEGFRVFGGFVQDADGGGARLINASPAIADCLFDANQTFGQCSGCQARGGAMSINGGAPTLTRVTFRNNVAFPAAISGIPKGGALWVGGQASVTITGALFENNRVFNRDGGAVLSEGQSTLVITDAAFNDNYATSGSGGAILVNTGTLRVADSTFRRNYTHGGGAGGITALGPVEVQIVRCTFTDQNAPIEDAERGATGGLDIVNGTLTVEHSTFRGNIAHGGPGGGLRAEQSVATVRHSTFDDNRTPGGSGPGIHAEGGRLIVRHCTFTNNLGNGAGIWGQSGAHLDVADSTFTANVANGGTGGGISMRGCTFALRRLTFDRNGAPSGSGGGVNIDQASSGALADSTFLDHAASGGSGAAVAVRGGSSATLSGLTISGSAQARAIQVISATLRLTDSTLRDNRFGALASTGGSVTIERVTIRGNTGATGAGASFIGGDFSAIDSAFIANGADGAPTISLGTSTSAPTLTGLMDRCVIRGNGLEGGSGSVLTANGHATITLRNSLLHDNAGSSGGALRVQGNAGVTLLNCTLAANNPGSGHHVVLLSSSAAGPPARLVARNSVLRGPAGGNRLILRATGTSTLFDVDTCNIEGGFAAGLNVSTADPLFAAPLAGDFRLGPASPAIDAGSDAFLPAPAAADLLGHARSAGAAVDLGAIESSSAPCRPVIAGEPEPVLLCPGTPGALVVAADGTGPLTYRWRRDGIALDPAVNPSAATPALELPIVSADDAGQYDVLVTGPCGTTLSVKASVIVRAAGDVACSPPACLADVNRDGSLNDDDLGEFITAYFVPLPGPGGYASSVGCLGAEPPFDALGFRADITADCTLNDDDLGLYLTQFFGGCF